MVCTETLSARYPHRVCGRATGTEGTGFVSSGSSGAEDCFKSVDHLLGCHCPVPTFTTTTIKCTTLTWPRDVHYPRSVYNHHLTETRHSTTQLQRW